mmetsp:Transcript_58749/g.190200  ORF Transcript_58749/g.190200 Transcript_58749/m.190200 type:complete len:403 (+) Transcript_58749:576-1784(+)
MLQFQVEFGRPQVRGAGLLHLRAGRGDLQLQGGAGLRLRICERLVLLRRLGGVRVELLLQLRVLRGVLGLGRIQGGRVLLSQVGLRSVQSGLLSHICRRRGNHMGLELLLEFLVGLGVLRLVRLQGTAMVLGQVGLCGIQCLGARLLDVGALRGDLRERLLQRGLLDFLGLLHGSLVGVAGALCVRDVRVEFIREGLVLLPGHGSVRAHLLRQLLVILDSLGLVRRHGGHVRLGELGLCSIQCGLMSLICGGRNNHMGLELVRKLQVRLRLLGLLRLQGRHAQLLELHLGRRQGSAALGLGVLQGEALGVLSCLRALRGRLVLLGGQGSMSIHLLLQLLVGLGPLGLERLQGRAVLRRQLRLGHLQGRRLSCVRARRGRCVGLELLGEVQMSLSLIRLVRLQ